MMLIDDKRLVKGKETFHLLNTYYAYIIISLILP